MNNIADTRVSNNERYYYLMVVIAIIFIAKALYMSFFITPLWSIPDEIGHLAYSYDIAEGRGIPVLGEAKISSDIMSSFKGVDDAKPTVNWIAQHPPAYYYLAAIPLKVGMNFTDNQKILFKLPRIISAISGGLLLISLFVAMRQVGLDGYRSLLLSSAVGFIPMLSHLSSGVNHDSTIFLFSAVAAYFFAKYIMQKNIHAAYWMAFWITLAAGMKMTVWVVMPPLLAFVALHLFFTSERWLRHTLGVSLLALAAPIAWMARNYYHFEDPFYTASSAIPSQLEHSFFYYLERFPVIDNLLVHFYGLIGWTTPGVNGTTFLGIAGGARIYFGIVLILLSLILILGLLKDIKFSPKTVCNVYSAERLKFYVAYFFIFFSTSFIILIYINSHTGTSPYNMLIVAALLLVWPCIIAVGLLPFCRNPEDQIMMMGMVVFIFFTAVLMNAIYNVYITQNRFGAIHGRYFYPVMPFILLSTAVAIKKINFSNFILALVVVGLAVAEMHSFVIQAIPFYWSFK